MLACTLFSSALIGHVQLLFFAPFLAILYYKKNYLSALWFSLFCGVIVDLIAPPARFGIYALNFCLTTGMIYHQRRNLFADSLSTLPIMTLLFSVISTLVQVVLLYIFAEPPHITLKWIFTDLMMLPLADALFAFVWFILPDLVFGRRMNRGRGYRGRA